MYFLKGLEGYPDIIPKTMTPSVSPEQAAGSEVLSSGGYDPCTFGVIKLIIIRMYNFCSKLFISTLKGCIKEHITSTTTNPTSVITTTSNSNKCSNPGDSYCCSHGILGFCKEGEGDCDADHECQGSLVCGTHNCDWGYHDCCRKPEGDEGKNCTSDVDCLDELVCGFDSFCRNPCKGATSCCSQGVSGYCKEGEGDCDGDSECEGSLVCGQNNCDNGGDADCCTTPCTIGSVTTAATVSGTSCASAIEIDTDYHGGEILKHGVPEESNTYEHCATMCRLSMVKVKF